MKRRILFCDICNKGFFQKTHLTKHSYSHGFKKPFVCETCKKEFSQKSRFNKHLSVHDREKPSED